jgi:hypothetical protein
MYGGRVRCTLTDISEENTASIFRVEEAYQKTRMKQVVATSLPSVTDSPENVGALTSHNPIGLHGLLRG